VKRKNCSIENQKINAEFRLMKIMENKLEIILLIIFGVPIYWGGRKIYKNRKEFTTDNLIEKSDDVLDNLFQEIIPNAFTKGIPKVSKETFKAAKIVSPFAFAGGNKILGLLKFIFIVITSPIWIPFKILIFSKDFLFSFMFGKSTDERKRQRQSEKPIKKESEPINFRFSLNGLFPSLYRLGSTSTKSIFTLLLLPITLSWSILSFLCKRMIDAKDYVDNDRQEAKWNAEQAKQNKHAESSEISEAERVRMEQEHELRMIRELRQSEDEYMR